MEFSDLKYYVSLSKDALDLLKAAYGALPKGAQRDKVEEKVKAAADLLSRADAKLAKDLGYRMCQCTFPPQIMLWREAERVWACPNANCGSKIKSAALIESESEGNRVKARLGRTGI